LALCCLSFAAVALCPALANADGGTLRFSREVDGYRITLFTAPTSLRAGPIDFSVMVQRADSDEPLLDLPVIVHVHPEGEPERIKGGRATTAAATNKLFHAVQIDLAEPGQWHVEVLIHAPERSLRLEADLEVGPPPPSWIVLGPWIAWPAIAILLFACHLHLVRRDKIRRRE
jgi:hypothetical protein